METENKVVEELVLNEYTFEGQENGTINQVIIADENGFQNEV